MKTQKEPTPVVLFSGNAWHTSLLKSMLEEAGIETFLKDELMGSRNPYGVNSNFISDVKVVVSSLDYDKARAIADEFEKNLLEAQTSSKDADEKDE